MNRCRSCQGDPLYKTRTCYLRTTLASPPMIRLLIRTISGSGNQRASASEGPPLKRPRNGHPVTSVVRKDLLRLAGPKLGGCEDQGEECAWYGRGRGHQLRRRSPNSHPATTLERRPHGERRNWWEQLRGWLTVPELHASGRFVPAFVQKRQSAYYSETTEGGQPGVGEQSTAGVGFHRFCFSRSRFPDK